MDELIKTICQALKVEAEAVRNYTVGISAANNSDRGEDVVKTLTLNRMDSMEHIQNLTVQLTKVLYGVPPEEGEDDA